MRGPASSLGDKATQPCCHAAGQQHHSNGDKPQCPGEGHRWGDNHSQGERGGGDWKGVDLPTLILKSAILASSISSFSNRALCTQYL